MSRETRLLAATIGVSIIVLLVLSRFRFPEGALDGRDPAAVQPLARLAARAAFDDLSLAVRELSGRVEGSLLVVRTVRSAPGTGDVSPTAAANRLVPALRVRDDAAVVAVPEGVVIDGIVGIPGPPNTIARDAVRGLAVVRVPATAAPVLSVREGVQPLPTPGYVAVAEASVAGASLRPVFVGRSDAVGDPRWDTPLVTVGRGAAGGIGAPVFTLDGRLAGLLTSVDGEPAMVPAQVVLTLVDQLLGGGLAPQGDIGVVAQPLDQALSAATGAQAGAAVAAVSPDGPAAAVLAPGDVITAVNGQFIQSADALRLRVRRAVPGSSLTLTVRRNGAFSTVPVTVRERPGQTTAGPVARESRTDRALGLTLRTVPGTGSEVVRVLSGSAAEEAGLRAGDLVVSLGGRRAPAPADIAQAFEGLRPGAALFLSVERDGAPTLFALRR